jgi:murein L,D-transpeptidase YcbB/YkuD
VSSVGGSRAPWWVWPVVGGVFLFMPGLVLGMVDRADESLEKYSARSEQSEQQSSDEYVPPCDTQAVLDALGMNVVQYQMDRGLHVDGLVGPQTGAALCAEDLPEGGA